MENSFAGGGTSPQSGGSKWNKVSAFDQMLGKQKDGGVERSEKIIEACGTGLFFLGGNVSNLTAKPK